MPCLASTKQCCWFPAWNRLVTGDWIIKCVCAQTQTQAWHVWLCDCKTKIIVSVKIMLMYGVHAGLQML